jgi:hypothetical protein
MSGDGLPDDVQLPAVLLALGYGGLLAIFASDLLRVRSAMHSVAVVGLLVLGLPTLLVQAWRLRAWRLRSRPYPAAFWLSVGYPAAWVTVLFVSFLLER